MIGLDRVGKSVLLLHQRQKQYTFIDGLEKGDKASMIITQVNRFDTDRRQSLFASFDKERIVELRNKILLAVEDNKSQEMNCDAIIVNGHTLKVDIIIEATAEVIKVTIRESLETIDYIDEKTVSLPKKFAVALANELEV